MIGVTYFAGLCAILVVVVNHFHYSSGTKLPRAYVATDDLNNILNSAHVTGLLRKKLASLQQNKEHDLVVLIDASSGVGPKDFQYEVEFAGSILSGFKVSAKCTRVAILPFSSSVTSVRTIDKNWVNMN